MSKLLVKRHSGFSLIEMMVAAGVMSLAILGFFSAMKNSSTIGKNIEQRIESLLVVNELREILSSEELCKANFAGMKVIDNANKGTVNQVTSIKDMANKVILQVGKKNNDVSINELVLGGDPVSTISATPQVLLIPFTIKYSSINYSGKSETKQKTINITATVADLKVVSCHATGAGVLGHWVKNPSSNDIYYNEGNVGVGFATPTRKLDVNGDVRIKGDLYMESSSGPYWFSQPEHGDITSHNMNISGSLRVGGNALRFFKMSLNDNADTMIMDSVGQKYNSPGWAVMVVGFNVTKTGGDSSNLAGQQLYPYVNSGNCHWYIRSDLIGVSEKTEVYFLAIPTGMMSFVQGSCMLL